MVRDGFERPLEIPDSAPCNDGDRQAAVDRAIAATAAERISFDDYSHRLDRIWAAETHGELRAVVADLPNPVIRAARPFEPRRRTMSPAWRHYLAVMSLLTLIWLLTTPMGYFWPAWPAIGWGVSLLFHCRRPASVHRLRNE